MKKRSFGAWLMAALTAFTVASSGPSALAAEPGTVLGTDTKDQTITAFVQNPGQAQGVTVQIGTDLISRVSMGPVTDREVSLKTIVLLDNSLSVTEKYRPFISQALFDMVAGRQDRELFTIAVFGEQIQYLVQDSSDYGRLKTAIESIEYHDQETYLTDVLYELLLEMEQAEDGCFKRIVIISDGVDNKSIGYTKEELYDLMKKNPWPVYTLGCTYKDNNEQLKNMFALSRLTGGRSYLLDEVADSMTVVNDLTADRDIIYVEAVPDASVCDGSVKAMQISFQMENGESVTCDTQVQMPFAEVIGGAGSGAGAGEGGGEEGREEKSEPEESDRKESEDSGRDEENEDSEDSDEDADEADEDSGVPTWAVAAAVGAVIVLMTGIAVTAVLLIRRKKRREEAGNGQEGGNHAGAGNHAGTGNHAGAGSYAGSGNHPRAAGYANSCDSTQVLRDARKGYVLRLSDQKNLAKTFECPLMSEVVIGKNPEKCRIVLDYDRSVSGTHCKIYQKDGKFYIEDLNSTNGTFVNNNRIAGAAEIYSGSLLTLGRLILKAEIL